MAVQRGEGAEAARDLLGRKRPRRIARVGAAQRQVLHHQQEIEPEQIDHGLVDDRMVHRDRHVRFEQARLVPQVAIAQMRLAMGGRVRLQEELRGPAAAFIVETQPDAAIGAIVFQQDIDPRHFRIRMPRRDRPGDPFRGQVFPRERDAIQIEPPATGRHIQSFQFRVPHNLPIRVQWKLGRVLP